MKLKKKKKKEKNKESGIQSQPENFRPVFDKIEEEDVSAEESRLLESISFMKSDSALADRAASDLTHSHMSQIKEEAKSEQSQSESDSSSSENESIDSAQASLLENTVTGRLTYYYKNKKMYLLMKIWLGIITIFERGFILILMINSRLKNSIFSTIYMVFAFMFWFSKNQTKQLIYLNYFVTVGMLTQYLFLCFHLVEANSPLHVPETSNSKTTILGYIFDKKEEEFTDKEIRYLKFFSFGWTMSDSQGLIVDAFFYVLFQLMIGYYHLIINFAIHHLKEFCPSEKKGFFIFLQLEGRLRIYVNYSLWRDRFYKLTNFIYTLLLCRVHHIMIFLFCFLSILNITYFFVVVLIFCFCYLYFVEFVWDLTENDMLSANIKSLKQVFKIMQITIWVYLVLQLVVEITDTFYPKSEEENDSLINKIFYFVTTNVVDETIYLSIVFVSMQLVLDLWNTSEYIKFIKEANAKKTLKSILLGMNMAYKFNEKKLKKILDSMLKKEELNDRLTMTGKQLSVWHAMFFNKDQRSEKTNQVLNNPDSMESSSEENENQDAGTRRASDSVIEQVSLWPKLVYKLYYFLNQCRNESLFKTTLSLYNKILYKNNKVLRAKSMHMKDFILGNYDCIGKNLSKLRDNYWKHMGSNPMDDYLKSRINPAGGPAGMEAGSKSSFITRQTKRYESQKVQQKLQAMGLTESPDGSGRPINPGAAILLSEIFSIGIKMLEKDIEQSATRNSGKLKNFNALEILTDDDNFFYNLEVTSKNNTEGFTIIKLKVLLTIISQIVISQWEYIAYVTFFIVQLISGGLVFSILPACVVTFALIEECKPRLFFWKVVFIAVCFNLCAKVAICSYFDILTVGESADSQDNLPNNFFIGLSTLLFGNLLSVYSDLLVIVIIICEVGLLDMQGLKDKSVVDYENINDAFTRLSVNDQNLDLFNEGEEKRNNYLESMRKALQRSKGKGPKPQQKASNSKQRNSKNPLNSLRPDGQKNLSQVGTRLKEQHRRKVKMMTFLKLTEEIKYNFDPNEDKFTQKNTSMLLWRVFSYHNKKPGDDMYTIMSLTQIGTCIYVLLFFTNMEGETSSFSESITYNQFSSSMVFMLFVQIFLVVIPDRFFYLAAPKNWRIKQIYKGKDNPSVKLRKKASAADAKPSNLKIFRAAVFQKATKNVTFIERVKKDVQMKNQQNRKSIQTYFNRSSSAADASLLMLSDKKGNNSSHQLKGKRDNLFEDYKYNPLFWKFFYNLALLIAFELFVFFYLPFMTHLEQVGSILCNSEYKSSEGVSTIACNNFHDNKYVIYFYSLYIIYFFTSSIQIQKGETIFKGRRSNMEKFSPPFKYIYIAYKAIPFLFEIKTALDWSFTRTGMDIWQWFKFEDIYGNLYLSKCYMVSKRRHALGDKMLRFEKLMFGVSILLGLLAIILAPMLVYSNFNPISEPNFVNKGKISFGIQFGDENYCELYSSTLFEKEEKLLKKEEASSFFMSFFSLESINLEESLRGINIVNLQGLMFRNVSDTFWQITPATYKKIIEHLENGTVKTYLNYELWQEEGYSMNIPMKSKLDEEVQRQLRGLMGHCFPPQFRKPVKASLNYSNYVRLNSKSSVLDAPKLPLPNSPFTKQIYLNMNCEIPFASKVAVEIDVDKGIFPKIYWSLSNDINMISGPFFFATPDSVTKAISTVATDTSIIGIYAGIIYIIGRSLRGVFAGGTGQIWYYDIPKAENLLRICEGVIAARNEGEVAKEETLYYQLIDLLRSPEILKIISGSYLAFFRDKRKKKLKKLKEQKASINLLKLQSRKPTGKDSKSKND